MYMSNACFKNPACKLEEELRIQEKHHVTFCATHWTKMSKLSRGTNSVKSELNIML